jgi:hypothetical protein
MTDKSHDLVNFMGSATRKMADDYERIRKRTMEDPGTAGDQGEEDWARLLKDWLPATYHVETKGRILTAKGEAGPQVDVLVLRPSYPVGLLKNKHYLASGVVAAFECKLTLRTKHIRTAMGSAAQIRRMIPKHGVTLDDELHSPVIYGLLAHGHALRSVRQQPDLKISQLLVEADLALVQRPIEMLDMICVPEVGFWDASKGFYPTNWPPERKGHVELLTTYLGYTYPNSRNLASFSPIGAFLTSLLKRLGEQDPSLKELADYFFSTGISGRGSGHTRTWPLEVLSPEWARKIDAWMPATGQ